MVSLRPRWPGFVIGALLGLANTLFIGFAIGSRDRDWFEVMFLVTVYGCVPGVLVGAMVGAIGESLGEAPRVLRFALIVVPSVLLVWALGHEFEMAELIPHSTIPTLVACVLLERWTRAVPEFPVPRAVERR